MAVKANSFEIVKFIEYQDYNKIYIELKYSIDNTVYVSDEISNGFCFSNDKGNQLHLYYYPRGRILRAADESIVWPMVLRKISPGDIISVSIDLNDLLQNYNNMTRVNLYICDDIFNIKSNECQLFLSPENRINKSNIISEMIVLEKISGHWNRLE
jgi:hypothetical protein